MKYWVKLYTEIKRDADMGSLTWAQRGIWSYLLVLAGELDNRDEDGAETGLLDTPERVAWHLRLTPDELDDALEAFKVRGMVMVDEVDGMLYLPNYARRQRRAPSDRSAAVTERVKRHRAQAVDDVKRDGNELVTSLKRGVTSSESESESETDTETDIGAIAPESPPDVVPIESEPEPGRPPDKDTPHRRYMAVVRDVTMLSLDVEQNAKRVGRAVRGLRKAEYTPDDVMRLYRKGGWWWREYWKGRNGQPPTPEELASTIEQGLEYERNGSARASPGGSGNGRLTGAAARDAFLRRHSGDGDT